VSIVDETWQWFRAPEQWTGASGIPSRLLEHLGYTGLTVAVSALIAIPIGLWVGHTGRLRGLAVVLSGALRALPTLGVLTYVVLLSGLGLTPITVALTVLAIPPLLAGTYAGLEAVDRATIDAARGMGMSEWQVLTKVEIPLALPLIVGGLRSATLQVVATATVAAYVGLGGLGRFIIDGIALRDDPRMVGGSIAVVVLALVLDALFVLLQKAATPSRAPKVPSRP